MTKLGEWLLTTAIFLGIWFSLLQNNILLRQDDWDSWLIPVYIAVGFGIYSVIVVLYRTFTFNDCFEAAEELKMEIERAKEDLKSKGFRFET